MPARLVPHSDCSFAEIEYPGPNEVVAATGRGPHSIQSIREGMSNGKRWPGRRDIHQALKLPDGWQSPSSSKASRKIQGLGPTGFTFPWHDRSQPDQTSQAVPALFAVNFKSGVRPSPPGKRSKLRSLRFEPACPPHWENHVRGGLRPREQPSPFKMNTPGVPGRGH
jgi:hypothetical protein